MAYKVVNEKHRAEQEEREIEEFVVAQKEKRKTIIKSTLAVIVCLGLVLAFCLPSISMLL